MEIPIKDLTFLFGLIFVFFIGIGIYLIYRRTKTQKAQRGEHYDLKSLMLPYDKKLPLKQNLANIFVSPYFWIIEFIVLALLSYFVVSDYIIGESREDVLLAFFASGLVSLGFTFIYTIVIWYIDHDEPEPLRFIPTLFLWGSFAALMAIIMNTEILGWIESNWPGSGETTLVLFVAPLLEEFLKALGLFALFYHKEFDDTMDGIFYGFLVGMGFAFIEDWSYYIFYSPFELGIGQWLELIFVRTVATGAGHGIFTAITGALLGLVKTGHISKRGFLSILLISAIVHFLFNLLGFANAIAQVNVQILGMVILIGLLFVGIKMALSKYKKKQKKTIP